MQIIVADLEWNGAYSRKAHGYFNEIIEIGAVKLNEAMELTSRFHALIKPVVSRKLSEVVTGLTSITAEELDEGGTFQTAVSRLRKWIGGEDAVFLTWSTTDLLVLMENCRYFFGSDRIPFLDRYADLQKYCQLRIEADTSQQMGLSKACERLGISEEDMALHRALDDSVLTGQVLQKVYDPVSFAEQMAVVDDAFYDRITFKNVILSDIDSPLIKRSELQFHCEDCGRNLKRVGDWKFRNRAFHADFVCRSCGREYTGRAQFKLRYEGVEVKRRLSERVKPKEAAGEAAPAADSGVPAVPAE